MKVNLTFSEIKKQDAKAILKAVKKLEELGQIEETEFFMTSEEGNEVN